MRIRTTFAFGWIGALLASASFGVNATIIENLPTCVGNRLGQIISISDGVDASDCTTGGATGEDRFTVACLCDTVNALGPYWKAVGGGGGAGVSGLSTADGGTALADNAVVRGDGAAGIQGSAVTIADTTGAISGAQSITGGASGTSTLTLDGDSGVDGASTVGSDGEVLLAAGAIASDGVQKNSPRFRLFGYGWKTSATAASQPVEWTEELVPQQGVTNPGGYMEWKFQTNSLGYVRAGMIQFTPTSGTVDGWGNTAIGYNAGPAVFGSSTPGTGYNNSFFGSEAGKANDAGSQNTFVGSRAGYSNVSGTQNTYVGQGAGYYTSTGSNVAIGWHALLNVTTGTSNVAIGHQAGAGAALASGNSNVFIGNSAALVFSSGIENVLIGDGAGTALNSGSQNVIIGVRSGEKLTTGAGNVFVGRESGGEITTQGDNTFIGKLAGTYATGADGVLVGSAAGILVSSGANNTCVGSRACYTDDSANATTTGASNTFLGYNSGQSAASQISNAFAVGSGAEVGTSNHGVLGDASVTDIHAASDDGATMHMGALHVSAVASPPFTCDGSHVGWAYVDSTDGSFCPCNGTVFTPVPSGGSCS